jgi:hypothetical protein
MDAAIAPDGPPRPRVLHLGAWVTAVVIAVIAYFVFEGLVAIGAFPARGADARLRTLGSLSVATTPPPGGVVIGRQDYHGKSGNFAKTPDIEIIYAVPASADIVIAYYRNLTVYHFTGTMIDPQVGTQLGSILPAPGGHADVELQITRFPPTQFQGDGSMKIHAAPPGTQSYVDMLIS